MRLIASVFPPLYVFKTSDLNNVFKISNPNIKISNAFYDLANNNIVIDTVLTAHIWDEQVTI